MLTVEIHPKIHPFLKDICSDFVSKDIGSFPGSTDIITFERVDIIAPFGCYKVELRPSSMSFVRVDDSAFRFQFEYSNIVSIHGLFKEMDAQRNERLFFMVLTLNTPVPKKLDSYPHIVFEVGCDSLGTLSLNEDHCKGNTKSLFKDSKHELLFREIVLRSGVNVASHGDFRSLENDYAVRAANLYDGSLYPLDDSLLFIPYPSRRIMYDEISYVLFVWPPPAVYEGCFYIHVRMKTEQKVIFENVKSEEHVNLWCFLRSRGLDVTNFYLDPANEKHGSYICSDSEEEEFDRNDVAAYDDDDIDADLKKAFSLYLI